MGNKDKNKYELIVEIKELLLKSTQFDLKNMENAYEISLEASKVLRLIYSNKDLTDNYEHKLNEYYELKKNEKYFKEVKSLFENVINKVSPDFYIYKDDFMISYYNNIKKGIYKTTETENFRCLFMELAQNWQFGILPCLIHTAHSLCEYDYNETAELRLSILSWTYDLYFLENYEQFFFEYSLFPTGIYLLLAYRKVLEDCLNVEYKFGLSDEQKQEYDLNHISNNLTKKIDFDSDELKGLDFTPREQKILNCIINSEYIKQYYSNLENRNLIYSDDSRKAVLSTISGKFKDGKLIKKGGYEELKKFFDNNPDLIIEVNKSKQ